MELCDSFGADENNDHGGLALPTRITHLPGTAGREKIVLVGVEQYPQRRERSRRNTMGNLQARSCTLRSDDKD